MKKELKITLIVGVVLLVVIIGLGFWAKVYQDKLNTQRAKDRVAALDLKNVTIGLGSANTGFYPNIPFDTSTYQYNSHFYEPLAVLNKEFKIEGQLASSWDNPSENVWRFNLRKDVKFHDGSSLTSNDVKASLDMAIANENTSFMVPTLESTKIIDDYTVELTTKSPTPLLANQLTTIFILPEKLITSEGFENPIGTGPYKYVSSDDSSMTLKRFDGYYGTKPKAENVVLKSFADSAASTDALKKGEVDVITGATDSESNSDNKDNRGKELRVATVPNIGTFYLTFDTVSETSPYITGVATNPFKDVRVREAFQDAINIPQLIKAGDLKYTVEASQTLSPTVFGYNPDIKAHTQDVAEAKRLMKEAGFENGFTVNMIQGQSTRRGKDKDAWTNELKKQLSEIGIKLEVTFIPIDRALFKRLAQGDNALFGVEYTCTTGDGLEAFENIYGDLSYYGNHYSSPEIKTLLTETASTFDMAKRSNIEKLGKLADEAKASIPMWISEQVFTYRDGLNLATRYDGYLLASDVSGAIPDSLENDYTYWDAFQKMLGLKK